MNSQTVEITSAGIRKILNKYTPERAIAEYVWNGFDAKATVVNIDFEIDNAELDTIKKSAQHASARRRKFIFWSAGPKQMRP